VAEKWRFGELLVTLYQAVSAIFHEFRRSSIAEYSEIVISFAFFACRATIEFLADEFADLAGGKIKLSGLAIFVQQ